MSKQGTKSASLMEAGAIIEVVDALKTEFGGEVTLNNIVAFLHLASAELAGNVEDPVYLMNKLDVGKSTAHKHIYKLSDRFDHSYNFITVEMDMADRRRRLLPLTKVGHKAYREIMRQFRKGVAKLNK